ncbi:21 kDa protein-like [Curcuma longa]|uniref:21 kDa protein-like n=1 Tax=Curcuma longa TaxID=136217 RepID=UPI003D9E6AC5
MITKPVLAFSFFISLLLIVCSSAATPPPPNTPSFGNATAFIRARCAATRYPGLCFSSLSPYATSVRRSPLLLALTASNVTIAPLRDLRYRFAALRSRSAPPSAATHDCADLLGDAADQAARALDELREMPDPLRGSTEESWRISNARTWMSAAMTDEGTCSDEFEHDAGGDVKGDVRRQLARVKRYTSNALALLSGLVDLG